MRQPLLAAVAAGFIGTCGVSVAMSREAPARGGAPGAAREQPASAPAGLRELAPLPALLRAPRAARPTRTRTVAAAPPAAPIVAPSPPPAPRPARQPVTTPTPPAPAPHAAPKEPAPTPAPGFDSSDDVFDSSG
jgi:hypothetical protein